MNKRTGFFIILVIALVLLAACKPLEPTPAPQEEIANPASVFCVQSGGELEMRQDQSGAVAGICIFNDGSECDEWAFFRKECKPGDSLPTPLPTIEPSYEDWLIYENVDFGYSFSYPADATISLGDSPRKNVTVTGALIGDDNWPVIMFNNPGEGVEFSPTQGVDLAQWLGEHNMLTDTLMGEVSIAGVKGVHIHHDRSPQSYASDIYFFVKSGRLFSVGFLHTGDIEDWELYEHFLKGIQFK